MHITPLVGWLDDGCVLKLNKLAVRPARSQDEKNAACKNWLFHTRYERDPTGTAWCRAEAEGQGPPSGLE